MAKGDHPYNIRIPEPVWDNIQEVARRNHRSVHGQLLEWIIEGVIHDDVSATRIERAQRHYAY